VACRVASGLQPLGLDAAELVVGERDDALRRLADGAAERVQAHGEVSGSRRDEAEPVEAGGEGADPAHRHPAGGGAEAGHAARRGGDPRAAGGVGG
jgi:hypothetical protein